MPSSVFRCISVFQVYFGVYTDPIITLITKFTTIRNVGPNVNFGGLYELISYEKHLNCHVCCDAYVAR